MKRFLVFTLMLVLGFAASIAGEAPIFAPGQVVLAKLMGKASLTTGGTTTILSEGQALLAGASVATDTGGTASLVFSNGVSVGLGSGTELGVTSFRQDPFRETINREGLSEEPTVSRTSLRFERGEIVVKVPKLHFSQGSVFSIVTPVGTIAVRGTTFRVTLRLGADKKADISIRSSEGQVTFASLAEPNVLVTPSRPYSATLPVR